MTQEDNELIKSLLHSRPHTAEQGETIVALYRKYVNPGMTNSCSRCGGSLHNYLKRLGLLVNTHENKSK